MDSEPKDLFKRAAELAAVVPEVMQPTAFNRALDLLMSQEGQMRPAPARKGGKSKSRRKPPASSTESHPVNEKRSATGRKIRSGSRPGPKAMLDELIGSGFFATGKTGADIISHQRKHRGHTYKAEELSPALVRLLRDGTLERDKNKDGIYRVHRKLISRWTPRSRLSQRRLESESSTRTRDCARHLWRGTMMRAGSELVGSPKRCSGSFSKNLLARTRRLGPASPTSPPSVKSWRELRQRRDTRASGY